MQLECSTLDYETADHARQSLEQRLQQDDISPSITQRAVLAVYEILTNLIKHPPHLVKNEIRIGCRRGTDQSLEITVEDWTEPFRYFLEASQNSWAVMQDHRACPRGGFGLGLVHHVTDFIDYRPSTDISQNPNLLVLAYKES